MKTIKTLFAILTLSIMFIACEAEAVNDEVGIELNDQFAGEEDEEAIPPGNNTMSTEEDEEDIQPSNGNN
ncbi:hypothetical protein [Aquimarina sediminis]|uniref:hypothetical protein n=1 Tax=Aquimarina sediminis TaxID=2070536 RepID=UPI000FFF3F71|nr:hypothetical protein [Aquimarina sediminis]